MSADNTLPVADHAPISATDSRTIVATENAATESVPGLWAWIARIVALLAAILAARTALIIFYFTPFFGVATGLDEWLDRQRCMVESLCAPPWAAVFAQVHHFGLLMVLTAILFFALATAGWPGPWRQEPALALDGWATRPRMTRFACLLLLITALEAVGYGAYQFMVAGHYPSVSVWLGGIFASGLAAALWDMERLDELKRTAAYLVAALGLVCIVLGASALLAGRMDTALLAVAGAILLVGGIRWAGETGASLRPLDFALILLFSLIALGLASWRAWSWKFAFVGDEWSFYYLARSIIHEPHIWTTPFSTHDSNRYHTVFSSMLQAWTLQLSAENVFGWRLSSVLPVVFAIPGVYAFSYWLAGRQAAWLSAALMAGGHVLLTFSMVPYNNTQAVTILAGCLGLFAFAQSGRSWLRYWLLGVGLGFGFLVFALARMVVLPIGVLLLVMAWPSIRRLLAQGSLIALGGLVTAAPILFNFNNWTGLLKATPVQSEVSGRMSLAEQVGRNALAGLLSFIANLHSQISHYVVGPHTDAATAVLMLAGIGCALAAILYLPKMSRRALGWFLAASIFTFVVSAIQQYGQVSITRMYVLPPLYAIYGGVGGAALARLLIPQGERARTLFLALLAASAVALGQLHVERVSLQRSDDLYTPYALMVRQLQPADPNLRIFLLQPPNADGTLHAILTAYELNWERIAPITLSELQSAGNRLCATGGNAGGDAMFLASVKTEGVDEALALVEACWPDSQVTRLNTPWDDVMIYRVTTAGLDTSTLLDRFEEVE